MKRYGNMVISHNINYRVEMLATQGETQAMSKFSRHSAIDLSYFVKLFKRLFLTPIHVTITLETSIAVYIIFYFKFNFIISIKSVKIILVLFLKF